MGTPLRTAALAWLVLAAAAVAVVRAGYDFDNAFYDQQILDQLDDLFKPWRYERLGGRDRPRFRYEGGVVVARWYPTQRGEAPQYQWGWEVPPHVNRSAKMWWQPYFAQYRQPYGYSGRYGYNSGYRRGYGGRYGYYGGYRRGYGGRYGYYGGYRRGNGGYRNGYRGGYNRPGYGYGYNRPGYGYGGGGGMSGYGGGSGMGGYGSWSAGLMLGRMQSESNATTEDSATATPPPEDGPETPEFNAKTDDESEEWPLETSSEGPGTGQPPLTGEVPTTPPSTDSDADAEEINNSIDKLPVATPRDLDGVDQHPGHMPFQEQACCGRYEEAQLMREDDLREQCYHEVFNSSRPGYGKPEWNRFSCSSSENMKSKIRCVHQCIWKLRGTFADNLEEVTDAKLREYIRQSEPSPWRAAVMDKAVTKCMAGYNAESGGGYSWPSRCSGVHLDLSYCLWEELQAHCPDAEWNSKSRYCNKIRNYVQARRQNVQK